MSWQKDNSFFEAHTPDCCIRIDHNNSLDIQARCCILRGVVIAFNKPYGVSSYMLGSDPRGRAHGLRPLEARPVGGLAADTEGLMLWTDEPKLEELLAESSPRYPHVYWIQVANIPSKGELDRLHRGVLLDGHKTWPCRAWLLPVDPDVPSLSVKPPTRPAVPLCWLGLSVMHEGDRHIRKVLGAVGHTVCRLVRVQIGNFALGDLAWGQARRLTPAQRTQLVGEENPVATPWRYRNMRSHAKEVRAF